MRDLAARGYQTLTLDEYWAVLEGRRHGTGRELLLTFDDGYAHVAAAVTPILKELSFSAVMFIPCAHLGDQNTWDTELETIRGFKIAGPDLLRVMEGGPWEIASHGWFHVDLETLDARECRRQLAASRERLSELLGRPILDLAYPFGSQNDEVRAAAHDVGYRMAFTAGRSKLNDALALDRLPITGNDSSTVFRLKTSAWAGLLYGIADRSPAWARSAARGLTALPSSGRL